jgi:hypothetical protein
MQCARCSTLPQPFRVLRRQAGDCKGREAQAAARATQAPVLPAPLQVDLWFRRQCALDVEGATRMLLQALAALSRMERWHCAFGLGAQCAAALNLGNECFATNQLPS